MALAKLGQILKGEVTSRNEQRGSAWLELDSGERALLPSRRMRTAFSDATEGIELTVVVIQQCEDRHFRPWFIVSEYLDDEPEVPGSDDSSASQKLSAARQAELAELYPPGKSVRGKFRGVRDGGIRVLLGDVEAFIPKGLLAGSKLDSFRRDVPVKAIVHSVNETGVILTRQR